MVSTVKKSTETIGLDLILKERPPGLRGRSPAVDHVLADAGLADVTRRNLNIQPTIKVPVGYRFNVRVNRDMLFELPYRPVAG